jgi:hypothetical protein
MSEPKQLPDPLELKDFFEVVRDYHTEIADLKREVRRLEHELAMRPSDRVAKQLDRIEDSVGDTFEEAENARGNSIMLLWAVILFSFVVIFLSYAIGQQKRDIIKAIESAKVGVPHD